jgi:beta-glucosidase
VDYQYAKGVDPLAEEDRSGFDEAIALAKNSEVVIMVLGEHGTQTGEARSRMKIDLPGLQQELLEEVYKVNPNIVLVLMNGRPLEITWAAEHLPGILETWHLGSQSGHAIAEVLFGDYNPGGKLTMTFPRNLGQVPLYYNRLNSGRPDANGSGYYLRYTDGSSKALYPFGYGLSYTTFDYSDLKIDDSDQNAIQVRVTVKNTGNLAGEEVSQLYIRDRVASIARPIKELKAFQKYSLAPGRIQSSGVRVDQK